MRISRWVPITAAAGVVILGIAFALIRSCLKSSSRRPDPPRVSWAPCVDLDPRSTPDSCPTCSGNTALINPFPIHGLHPGGCWNADSHRLVPGTLKKGLSQCPDEAVSLDVEADGRFVGRDSDGKKRCEGPALVGASFTVEAWIKIAGTWQTRATSILIAQARSLQGTNATPDAPSPMHRAYMLAPDGEPAASLCDAAEARPWVSAWLEDAPREATLPRPVPAVAMRAHLTPVQFPPFERYALPIPGAVFNEKGNHIDKTDPRNFPKTPGWFNIACAGGALAKMRIERLEQQDSLVHRGATLKMLTARYCADVGYTVVGPMIKEVRATEPEPADMFGSIEARWDEKGATCLSHSRLYRPNTVIPVLPKWGALCWNSSTGTPATCTEKRFLEDVARQCKHALPLPPCGASRPPGTVWTTYGLDHEPGP